MNQPSFVLMPSSCVKLNDALLACATCPLLLWHQTTECLPKFTTGSLRSRNHAPEECTAAAAFEAATAAAFVSQSLRWFGKVSKAWTAELQIGGLVNFKGSGVMAWSEKPKQLLQPSISFESSCRSSFSKLNMRSHLKRKGRDGTSQKLPKATGDVIAAMAALIESTGFHLHAAQSYLAVDLECASSRAH